MSEPILKVEDLKKAYNGKEVVKGINFEVKKGGTFGILGPNGAGKTTAIEMIEALRPIDSGRVVVDGFVVNDQPQEVKEIIGIQPQSSTFYDRLTLVEQLKMFESFYGTKINPMEILREVELEDKAKSPVEKMSGGQKQRFSIAAALVNRPRLLFMDEPTTGLDPQARRHLWDLIRAIKQKGITVILTTHYLEEAELLCDRVAIMDNGKVIALDSPKNLVKALLKRGFKKEQQVEQANLEDVFYRPNRERLKGSVKGMGRYFSTVWSLCKILTIRWSRDPVALFFIFLFPLIFLLVFGAMSKNDSVNFNVAVINHSGTEFAARFEGEIKEIKAFKIKEIKNFEDAKEKMGRGELASIVELPSSFGKPNADGVPSGSVVVYFEGSDPTTGQTVASVMQKVLDDTNKQLTAAIEPLAVEQKATETTNLSRFDYTVAGIVGFSILSLAIFGMANGFPADKKTGALRRLRATPLRASQLILATALEYMFVGLLSVASVFLVASLLFDFDMRGNYLVLAIFATIGIFCLFGFGLAIGGWAKNENQSAPLSNLVAFPMMFLSGVFFPTFLMPEWLQGVADFLPLTPIVEGIRLIVTENASLLDLGSQLAVIGGWTVVIYVVAFKVFRWE